MFTSHLPPSSSGILTSFERDTQQEEKPTTTMDSSMHPTRRIVFVVQLAFDSNAVNPNQKEVPQGRSYPTYCIWWKHSSISQTSERLLSNTSTYHEESRISSNNIGYLPSPIKSPTYLFNRHTPKTLKYLRGRYEAGLGSCSLNGQHPAYALYPSLEYLQPTYLL